MEELKVLSPMLVPPDQFPSSEELPEGAITVEWRDRPQGAMVDMSPNVVYDTRDGLELHLQILTPMPPMFAFGAPPKKNPLIVYVPGSAWMKQNVFITLPRMIEVCQRGYAVAIVEYRHSEVAGFPAQVEDAKTAVRFMRKHAGEYNIDTDNIALWGDSSGGHTVTMAGITGDGILDNGQYGEYSCSAKCIVDWFGPTDVSKMCYYPSAMEHTAADTPEGLLLGRVPILGNEELAAKASPMTYLSADKEIPPILIMHGSKDMLVPFNQSVRLYDKLVETGKDVVMYKLEGGGHGTDGFGSLEIIDVTLEFVSKYIG